MNFCTYRYWSNVITKIFTPKRFLTEQKQRCLFYSLLGRRLFDKISRYHSRFEESITDNLTMQPAFLKNDSQGDERTERIDWHRYYSREQYIFDVE